MRWILLALLAAALPCCSPTVQQPGSFYATRSIPLNAKPGDVIGSEQIPGAPRGAFAFRVLFVSTGLRGEPVLASGTVVTPVSRHHPDDGRNVVVWGHPTTGLAERCAPSIHDDVLGTIPGLDTLLAHGDIVAAPDYLGLGVSGPPSYLVGITEAHAMLDAARAAQHVAGDASQRVALWGHSQGGHAALFAGTEAAHYAPELTLVGVAVAAPATNLARLLGASATSWIGRVLSAYALDAWSRAYGLSLSGVADTSDSAFRHVIADCSIDASDAIQLSIDSRDLTLNLAGSQLPKLWARRLSENSISAPTERTPLFIAQGTADSIVPPSVTNEFVRSVCRHYGGDDVWLMTLPDTDHLSAGFAAAGAAVEWMQRRFAGEAAPTNCESAVR